MTRILIVLSAADRWTRADGSLYESGMWAQEFVDLDEPFLRAGFEVDLASPGGVVPTMDKRSLDPKLVGEEVAERMRAYLAATLRGLGAAYEQGPNWKTHIVQDGNLLTGQNPQSSAALAEMVIAALR